MASYPDQEISVVFDTWYEYEGGYSDFDGFTVELYDGTQWISVAPAGGWVTTDISASTNYCGSIDSIYVDAKPGFTDLSNGWLTKTITTTMSANPSDFKIRFVHGSDSGNNEAGAFIDNVGVYLE